MADVRITEYTDPGCPWAWSAEPFRRRLDWLYSDRIEWRVRLVGLAESADVYEERGFTPAKQAKSFRRISREHGMPIDTSVRPRMAATLDACRAVVAARLRAPVKARPLLRELRIQHFSGALLDQAETIDAAAQAAGIDPSKLREWSAEDEVAAELEQDLESARRPMPAARILDHKLANWSGGRRYTCPSYEIMRLSDAVTISVPGFQPFAAYDVILANLVPDLDRCPPADDAAEVLEWASEPLASKEVAVVCDTDLDSAREALGRVADERHIGADGLWQLRVT